MALRTWKACVCASKYQQPHDIMRLAGPAACRAQQLAAPAGQCPPITARLPSRCTRGPGDYVLAMCSGNWGYTISCGPPSCITVVIAGLQPFYLGQRQREWQGQAGAGASKMGAVEPQAA